MSANPQDYELRPDPHALTISDTDQVRSVTQDVDYEPHPERSLPVSREHTEIVNAITRLYSGSASEADMQVYDGKAIYDDPWSYCDTRYKIAGQWFGKSNSLQAEGRMVMRSPCQRFISVQVFQ